jgi:predicted  nucleic acid-binding Zn-ribbon protein
MSAPIQPPVPPVPHAASSDQKSRFYIKVPKPNVQFSLGKPDGKFGYLGASLKADDHLYWSIGKDALLENKGSVAGVTGGFWSLFAKKELTVSGGANANFVSKRLCVISAGAGYAEDFQLGFGDDPPIATFNPSDLDDILEPSELGVTRFDDDFAPRVAEMDAALGYSSPSLVSSIQAKAASSKLAKAQSLLFGAPADAAKNAFYIAQFRDAGGLLGLLQEAAGALSRIDRALHRPESIPLVGEASLGLIGRARTAVATTMAAAESVANDVFKVDKILLHVDASRRAKDAATEKAAADARIAEIDAKMAAASPEEKARLEAEKTKLQAKSERLGAEQKKAQAQVDALGEGAFPFKAEVAAIEKNKNTALQGNPSDPQSFWKQPETFLGLLTSDFAHLLRPLRNYVRAVRDTVSTLAAAVDTFGQLLGLKAPPPSAIGLIAKHGVNMITPDRVFGYAGDGFHFVSARKVDPTAGLLAKLRAKARALREASADLMNFVLGKDAPRPAAVPGFFVETSGRVDLRSQQDVRISATDEGSMVRVLARDTAEIAADSAALVSSRKGPMEVVGRTVHLGVPDVEAAKKGAQRAAMLEVLQRALDAASAEYDVAVQRAKELAEEIEDLYDDLGETEKQRAQASARLPMGVAVAGPEAAEYIALGGQAEAIQARIRAKEAAAEALDVTVSAAAAARDSAVLALENGQNAVVPDLGSRVEPRLGFGKKSQAVTEKLSAAAIDETAIYGGKTVSVESTKVEITAVNQVTGAGPAAKITAETDVVIEVGAYKITVAKDGITIAAGAAGPKVQVTVAGISLDAAGKPLAMKRMSAMDADASGPMRLDGGTVLIG